MAQRSGLLARIRALPPCEDCRASDGLWRADSHGGLERCHCLRGRLLKKLDGARARRLGLGNGEEAVEHHGDEIGALRDERGGPAVATGDGRAR
jgi:hypothetical protein